MIRFAAALAVLLTGTLAAADDPAYGAREAVAGFASGLSNDNPELALSYVSKSFGDPGYDAFARNLRALLEQNEVTSSITPVTNEGNELKRVLELDWYLEIRSKSGELALVRRRETVRCTVERASPKRKWLVTGFDPVRLLDLPQLPR